VAQHLKDHDLPITEVNVGERARDPEKFFNKKAEVYWGFRMRAEAGDVAGLTDERAIAQLVGVRYSHNSRGQVVIESKDDARKRGVKSPDRAEAIILAFAELTRVHGLLEYFRQESERIAAASIVAETFKPSCPKCGSQDLTFRGVAWTCKPCGASGIDRELVVKCPKCQSQAVARIGSERHCNQCGHQSGNKPPNPNPYTRGDMLRGYDSQKPFGWGSY
jgi:transposase-like protein